MVTAPTYEIPEFNLYLAEALTCLAQGHSNKKTQDPVQLEPPGYDSFTSTLNHTEPLT